MERLDVTNESNQPAEAGEPNIRKRAHAVAAAIREFVESGLSNGSLRSGDKLPTERELMETFGGGRNIVRKVLSSLESEGIVTRQVGSGTFISDNAAAVVSHASERGLENFLQAAAQDAGPLEVMELRKVFEPTAVELASTRASAKDLKWLQHCLEMSLKPLPLEEYEKWDDELHRAITKATHNVLFERVYDIISTVRNNAEWGILKKRSLTDEQRGFHSKEHVELVEAICQRDARKARAAMVRHLNQVHDNMFNRGE